MPFDTLPSDRGYVITEVINSSIFNEYIAVGGCADANRVTPAVTSGNSPLELVPGVVVPPQSQLYVTGGTGSGTVYVNGYYYVPTS